MASPYPPHHIHSTRSIHPSQARAVISNYLEQSKIDPSLHPNSLLTENGPIPQSGGSNLGVVLHNLQRVKSGLKGKRTTSDLSRGNNPAKRQKVSNVGGAAVADSKLQPTGNDKVAMLSPDGGLVPERGRRRAPDPYIYREPSRKIAKAVAADIGDRVRNDDQEASKNAKVDNLATTTTNQQQVSESPVAEKQWNVRDGKGVEKKARKKDKPKHRAIENEVPPQQLPLANDVRDRLGPGLDKEARRRDKKERNKQRKKEKEVKSQRERDAEL